MAQFGDFKNKYLGLIVQPILDLIFPMKYWYVEGLVKQPTGKEKPALMYSSYWECSEKKLGAISVSH